MAKIAVSAGHYPAAPGASYADAAGNKYTEHAIACAWQATLGHRLEALGHEVIYVKSGTLTQKIAEINAAEPLLAIEIHFNSAKNPRGDPVGEGCETLYSPKSDTGKVCARFVQSAMERVVPPGRGTKEGWYRMDVPGRVDFPGDVEGDEAADAFLKQTRCVALIVEPEFIHRIHIIGAQQASACEAIADALGDCVKWLGGS